MGKSSRIPFLIDGGGIGGLAAALATAKTGRPVHVIDKAAQFAEIGAGLQLAPNATRTLDRLGASWRKSASSPCSQAAGHDGRRFGRAHHLAGSGPEVRRALRLPVYSHAPRRPARSGIAGLPGDSLITLESSKEVASVEDLSEGARVNCADGSVYECDGLVGADGR
jgi:3-hydroxybenzoate 6-monooxygenase